MKKFAYALFVCALFFGMTTVFAAAPKVFLVGDSTVSSFNDPYYYPRYGWGTKIGDYLDGVEIVNYALSGRSSKSFTKEMNYRNLKKEISKGDYLFIAFGHNDEKNETERYTNANGSISDEGSFKNILFEKYIKLANDVKATPILCTPIVRRNPENIYEGSYIHNTQDVEGFPGGDYAQAIRDLAAETNTFLIDNTVMTKELYESLGADENIKLHAWIKHRPESVDNTHLNAYGASYVAYLVANALPSTKCKLAKKVKKNIQPPVEALVLEKNPQYIIPKYEAPTADTASKNWKTTPPLDGNRIR
ncbi:MAG: rhamnogalacturonan acetylesterase [Prevotella sp.]|nr:rhamnogalacturonan acetylesterase [Prevotella sp.]